MDQPIGDSPVKQLYATEKEKDPSKAWIFGEDGLQLSPYFNPLRLHFIGGTSFFVHVRPSPACCSHDITDEIRSFVRQDVMLQLRQRFIAACDEVMTGAYLLQVKEGLFRRLQVSLTNCVVDRIPEGEVSILASRIVLREAIVFSLLQAWHDQIKHHPITVTVHGSVHEIPIDEWGVRQL